jgi:N utilization substance protein A
LAPAKAKSVELIEDEKIAMVKVDNDQLSLAIGRSGQNVRLAARMTGWKINVSGIVETAESSEEPNEETPTEEPAESKDE